MNATLIKLFLVVGLVCAPILSASAALTVQSGNELKEINQLSEQGNQAAALDRVNSYLASNPKNAEAMFMRGVILVELNKREDAIKAFTDLTEKYPNLPEPYNNLAVLYADQGQYDKARKALESAIKTHPSYATAHENLGDIYARLASEAYDKALKLDTSNTRAQNKLSMITDLFSGGKRPATKPLPSPVNTTPVAPTVTAPASGPVAQPTDKPKASPAESKPVDSKSVDSKPLDKPVEGKPADANESSIIDAVNAWAEAWSDKNVDRYLDSYAKEFKTPSGESRKQWENMRRERINKPSKISVKLNKVEVTMESDSSAKVTFRQSYKATGLDNTTNKTLNMVKDNNRWLIVQERVGRY